MTYLRNKSSKIRLKSTFEISFQPQYLAQANIYVHYFTEVLRSATSIPSIFLKNPVVINYLYNKAEKYIRKLLLTLFERVCSLSSRPELTFLCTIFQIILHSTHLLSEAFSRKIPPSPTICNKYLKPILRFHFKDSNLNFY